MNAHLRARLKVALAALCDDELHERLWLRGERGDASELSFEDTVLFLIDELSTDDKSELLDHVLADGTEVRAFSLLADSLQNLVDVIGPSGSYDEVRSHSGDWEQCLVNARALRDIVDSHDLSR